MFELSKQIEEWHQLSLKDSDIPLNLLITTKSMEPSIRANKDQVVILNTEDYNLGDIILYKKDKMYRLHRIIKIKDNEIYTMGDNSSYVDLPILYNDILGKVVLIKSDERIIDLKQDKEIKRNKRLVKTYIIRMLINKIKNKL